MQCQKVSVCFQVNKKFQHQRYLLWKSFRLHKSKLYRNNKLILVQIEFLWIGYITVVFSRSPWNPIKIEFNVSFYGFRNSHLYRRIIKYKKNFNWKIFSSISSFINNIPGSILLQTTLIKRKNYIILLEQLKLMNKFLQKLINLYYFYNKSE